MARGSVYPLTIWFAVVAATTALPVNLSAQAASAELHSPATATPSGDTGLWRLPTADVLDAKAWTVGLNRVNTDRPQGFTDVTHWAVGGGLGVGNRLEIFGRWDMLTAVDRDGNVGEVPDHPFVTSGWNRGPGDIHLGAKVRFHSEALGNQASTALRVEARLPVGSEHIGTGRGDLEAAFVVSKEIARAWQVTGTSGVRLRGDSSRAERPDGMTWGGGAGRDIGNRSRVFAELQGMVEWSDTQIFDGVLTRQTPRQLNADALAGLTVRIRGDVQIGAAVAIALHHPGGRHSGDRVGIQARLTYHPGRRRYTAVPTGGVLLRSDASTPAGTDPVPAEWDGRLLRVGVGSIVLDGEAQHWHMQPHALVATTGAATDSQRPFGLKDVAANSTHRHQARTISQWPAWTGPAANLPPSIDLTGVITRTPLAAVAAGTIVGFVGHEVPPGWRVCDGTAGTLPLMDVYIRIRRDRRESGVVGVDAHTHDVGHEHEWVVDAPATDEGLNFAFFENRGDQSSDSRSIAVNHVHPPAKVVFTGGSDAVAARPPSVRIRFIQAERDGLAMPKGAAIPFSSSAAVPFGWEPWLAHGGESVVRRFIAATADPTALGTTFGTELHRHSYLEDVQSTLQGVNGTAPTLLGEAPPIAAQRHAHALDVRQRIETAPASFTPLHVSIPILIRR